MREETGPESQDVASRTGGGSAPGASGAAAADTVTLRLVMPDRWLEQVEELPLDMSVESAKRIGLRKLLMRSGDDPDDYYVEYAEREVRDESQTLAELGVQAREIFSIRKYDLGHYPSFRG